MSYINTYVKGKVDLLSHLDDESGFIGNIVSPAGLISPVFESGRQAQFFVGLDLEVQEAYTAASNEKFGEKVTDGHLRALNKSVQVRKAVVRDRLIIGNPGVCPECPPETVANAISSLMTGKNAQLKVGFDVTSTRAAEIYLEKAGCVKLFSPGAREARVNLPGLLHVYTAGYGASVWIPSVTMANLCSINLSPYSTSNRVTGLRYDVHSDEIIAEEYHGKMRKKNMSNSGRWSGWFDWLEWRPNGWQREEVELKFGNMSDIDQIELWYHDSPNEARQAVFEKADQAFKDFGFENGWDDYVAAARRLLEQSKLPGNSLLSPLKSSIHFWGDVIGYANPTSSAAPLQIWDGAVKKKHPLEGRIKILPDVQGIRYSAMHGIADLYEWAKYAGLPEKDRRQSLDNPTRVMMYNCPRGYNNRGYAAETELAKEISRQDGDWEDLELQSESFPTLEELDAGNAKQSLKRPIANWLQVPSTCYFSDHVTVKPGARAIYVTVESERFKFVLTQAEPEVPAVLDPNDSSIVITPGVPAIAEVWEYRYRHSFESIEWGQWDSSLEDIIASARHILDDPAARIYYSETKASKSKGYGSEISQTVKTWAAEQLAIPESRFQPPPAPPSRNDPDYVSPTPAEDYMYPWATAMMGNAFSMIPVPTVTNKPETRLMRTMFGGVDQEHLCVSIITGGIPLQTVRKSAEGM